MNQIPNKQHDITIIGGGISGLGLALEASNWGFDVLLLEKDKLCQATSANSLRIIHGGFRYLQSLNFARLLRSMRAKNELIERYSRFIKPLLCAMPLQRFGLKSNLPIQCANGIYNLFNYLASGEVGNNFVLSSKKVDAEIKLLQGRAPNGALVWQDGMLSDPQGFTQAITTQATQQGALIKEAACVNAITRNAKNFTVAFSSQGEVYTINSKVVVNASGPWLEKISEYVQPKKRSIQYAWCRAFNLVLSKLLQENIAVGCESVDQQGEKRLFFVTPRGSHSAIGTAYLPFKGSPQDATISEEEINNFLVAFNQAFPGHNLNLSDVTKVELGILPIMPNNIHKLSLVGDECLLEDRAYIEILSTKYTTFLPQARKLLKKASKYLKP